MENQSHSYFLGLSKGKHQLKMSQRALKKRDYTWQKCEKELHQPMYRKQVQPLFTHRSKYIQRTNGNGTKHTTTAATATNRSCAEHKSNRHGSIVKQKCSSTPNLTTIDEDDSDFANRSELQRSHSESDLSKIPESNVMAHAKSEFHLTSIASTHVAADEMIEITNRQNKVPTKSRNKHFAMVKQSNHKRVTSELNHTDNNAMTPNAFHFPRSLRPSVAATQTLPPPSPASSSSPSWKIDCTDSANIRIPIVGFEVMEERARFTVNFILHVTFCLTRANITKPVFLFNRT